jgi:hypothetical protein
MLVIMMQLKEIEGAEGHQARILALWIRSGSDGGPVVHAWAFWNRSSSCINPSKVTVYTKSNVLRIDSHD